MDLSSSFQALLTDPMIRARVGRLQRCDEVCAKGSSASADVLALALQDANDLTMVSGDGVSASLYALGQQRSAFGRAFRVMTFLLVAEQARRIDRWLDVDDDGFLMMLDDLCGPVPPSFDDVRAWVAERLRAEHPSERSTERPMGSVVDAWRSTAHRI